MHDMRAQAHALEQRVDAIDWTAVGTQLDVEGYAIGKGLLTPDEVSMLSRELTASTAMRRTLLETGDLGRGEIFPLDDPLPAFWAALRARLYRHLVPVANRWNEILDDTYRFPAGLDAFLAHNRQAGQSHPQSYGSRLATDDFLALHQRSDGARVFPLQLVALLSEPGADFRGGEFVMTEQRPRMQSRPIVVPLRRGDVAIIGTAQRPFRGTHGHYRVNLRHAISRVREGQRIGVELAFHDGP